MERFWSKVQKSAGCWEWTAARLRRKGGVLSYGSFHLNRRRYSAHRIAWELTNGPIPAELWVLHKCDNQGCVNPDHLYLGTHADNTGDATQRGRMTSGERRWNHKLTETDIPLIRALAATGLATERIGPQFGVSGSTIRYILRGERWKHVA